MKPKFLKLKVIFVIILTFTIYSNAYGDSDIFVVNMFMKDQGYEFGNPIQITQRKGYNNQPYFLSHCRALIYSSQNGNQTDIYRYNISSRLTTRLTNTPDSEYSPTPMPDGKSFSVVQQINKEGPRKGAQALMAFSFKGGKPRLLFENNMKVGYHTWIDHHQVALFILGSPITLQLVDLNKGKAKKIAKNIGRSLFKVPGKNEVSFIQFKKNKKPGIIKTIDLKTMRITSVTPLLKGNQYYTWTPNGDLLMGVGAVLYKFTPGVDREWISISDFGEKGISKITRLAVSPDSKWLAIVSEQ